MGGEAESTAPSEPNIATAFRFRRASVVRRHSSTHRPAQLRTSIAGDGSAAAFRRRRRILLREVL